MAEQFIQVTKDEFFASVGQLDVHPWPDPDRTLWRLRDLTTIGITTPGYMQHTCARLRQCAA